MFLFHSTRSNLPCLRGSRGSRCCVIRVITLSPISCYFTFQVFSRAESESLAEQFRGTRTSGETITIFIHDRRSVFISDPVDSRWWNSSYSTICRMSYLSRSIYVCIFTRMSSLLRATIVHPPLVHHTETRVIDVIRNVILRLIGPQVLLLGRALNRAMKKECTCLCACVCVCFFFPQRWRMCAFPRGDSSIDGCIISYYRAVQIDKQKSHQ